MRRNTQSASAPGRVLVVDDDARFARALARRLKAGGLAVELMHDGQSAIDRLQIEPFDVLVLDLRMRPVDGWDVLRALITTPKAPRTVLLSGFLDVQTTVRAVRAGAADVLEKSMEPGELCDRISSLTRAVSGAGAKVPSDVASHPDRDAADAILGESDAVALVRRQIRSVARYPDLSVLVYGETGTGKELVAQAIHELGESTNRFVSINCTAIPERLFESELFGHAAGAFTGARQARGGLLEVATDGTLFLDEVGDMPASLQPKLLRVLETRTFRRLGSNRDLPFRARVVSATNAPLIGHGAQLRPDLYYRLCGYTIVSPPLRDRANDFELLARHFLEEFAHRYGGARLSLDGSAVDALGAYDWPGNVRELRAVIDQAAILAQGKVVGSREVVQALEHRYSQPADRGDRRPVARHASPPPGTGRSGANLRELERNMIVEAYESSGRNASVAARKIGIPRTTLRDKLKRYGVT